MKTQLKKIQKGFTLVEIMIVVAIIGLLVAIALPNFMVARKKSQIKSAQASMKQIEGAVEQARLDDLTIDDTDLTVDGTFAGGGEGVTACTGITPDYLKVWPNPPGFLSCSFNAGSNDITVQIEGINGGATFTAYDDINP